MRLASYVPGELIPLPLSGSIPGITPCCRSLLKRVEVGDSVAVVRFQRALRAVGEIAQRAFKALSGKTASSSSSENS